MKRKKWVLSGAAVLVGVAAAGGLVVLSSAKPASPSPVEPASVSATVQKGTLSAMVSVDGTLTYQAQPDGSPYSVINNAQGTYTELPLLGHVVSQGQVLYRVNDRPVVLLFGSTPAYRTLTSGTSGADVAELNADLVSLGYATSTQISPMSASFGSATTSALESLQGALGAPQNGTLSLGEAVFEPAALRVTTMSAQLGGVAQNNQMVLQATSTTRIVQVALDVSQQSDVAVGDTVRITLPNNQTTSGAVSSVGSVATCPSSSGSASSNSSSAETGTDSCSSASSGSTTPTISVDVAPVDQKATGAWDLAPVQVGITTADVPDALAVPVTALLAQSSGGYAVEVVAAGKTNHLVGVSLGLFDDAQGLVQVTGSGLVAGQKVVVPSP